MANKKILVVDDEVQLVEMIKIRLESNGYEVITAYNGEEGVEKAIAEQPGLILLDIMMPGMDGFETLRKLKKDAKTTYMAIVMLTAKAETQSIMQAENLGSADYIIKPFDTEELLDLVKKYI